MSSLSVEAQRFVEMLDEPKNTLGRTEEAVAMVLANPDLIADLYQCYFQPDEWVRLRVSSSFKRLWRADEQLVAPYLDGFVNDVSKINQPSINWTFAQLCSELDHLLSAEQRTTSCLRLKSYLEDSDDWIVQNTSIEALGQWAAADAGTDPDLSIWLKPRLETLAQSPRKSVARRAASWIEKLY